MTIPLRAVLLCCILPVCIGAPRIARAVEVYRCIAANGAVSYQDKPCGADQRQTTVQLSDEPIVTPPSVPAPASTAPATSASTAVPMPPPAPLPVMYACTSYDGDKKYLSDDLPAPYPVPLGAMGYPGRSLDQAYGGRDRLGLSAPEEARKPVIRGGPLLANAQVMVQDYCHPASHTQVCDELHRRYDANHEKLRMAFPSEQPPLQEREDELNQQMQGC